MSWQHFSYSYFSILSTLAPRRTQLLSDIKRCSSALLVYSEENQNHLPPANRWGTSAQKIINNEEVFRQGLSIRERGSWTFALNSPIAGQNPAALEPKTGLLFATTKNEPNAHDNFESLRWGVYGKGTIVSLEDGSAKYIQPNTKLGPSELNGPMQAR